MLMYEVRNTLGKQEHDHHRNHHSGHHDFDMLSQPDGGNNTIEREDHIDEDNLGHNTSKSCRTWLIYCIGGYFFALQFPVNFFYSLIEQE